MSSFSKDDENYSGTEGSKYKPWICKNCGTRNPILNETCTKCGMKKEQPTDVKSAGNKEDSNIDFFSRDNLDKDGDDAKDLEFDFWICPRCGSKISHKTTFCKKCGYY